MKILLTKYFVNHCSRLKRKLPNLIKDLVEELKRFNEKTAISIGKSVYKIRIKSRDLNKGKSKGLRCYVYFYRKAESIAPFCLYLKSEHDAVPNEILKIHMQFCIREILKS
ncbi:hypothetical protein JW911_00020 [Candidatus Peregrinibacteria bacterium]|nr:hypothetical protein [Candidatus Peregrinibacteria bacterium]